MPWLNLFSTAANSLFLICAAAESCWVSPSQPRELMRQCGQTGGHHRSPSKGTQGKQRAEEDPGRVLLHNTGEGENPKSSELVGTSNGQWGFRNMGLGTTRTPLQGIGKAGQQGGGQ